MSETSIKKAALITAGSKYINIFLGIFFSAILSRILSPYDYGIVAIVTVFTSFFMVLSNCGLGIAVIQRKDFGQKEIDTLFTFSFYFALILSGIFCLLAYPISLFYKDSCYIPICILLSIPIFFNTINSVPDGLLKKDKKFFLIGLRLIIVSFLTYGITIILALLEFKYYALVIQSIISSILIFLWNLRNARVHLQRKIDWNVVKSIFNYSGYNFLFNFVNYFSRNLDKLIIGKVLGNEELAQYNKAYHFMLYPVQNLTNIITPALHPILSDFQNDIDFIYEKYIKILKLLSLIGVFVTPICFGCSKEIIVILYGNQWISAIECFKWMSLAIWAQMLTGTTGSLFASLNDTKRQFENSILNTGITIVAFIIGAYTHDIVKLSFICSIAFIIQFFTTFHALICGTMKSSFLKFFIRLLPDLLIMLALFIFSVLLNRYIYISNIFLSLLIKGTLTGITYLILLITMKQISFFAPILPAKLRNKINKD